ncbi:uncharacterized protein LOC124777366 [Schistocerca piceifrons]|uniref:uncharacterized protein LOC124777366 n=1 Tax=Schistocerca piceifrons TaxID=274613 RepID=UPI001F5E8D52|nr:uncharacterized protein LOC124777366 [Schistocerca piceifrons]
MAAKFSWCVPSTKKLIEMYEADEALYSVRHPEYKNRLRRLESYKNIAEVISREIRSGCTAEDIKKKINGLRSSYSHEKAKMLQSKSGASAQAVYTPQVYWFHLLKFLDQDTEADESVSNVEGTESGSERGTPTLEEMFEHEMQAQYSSQKETDVACSEPQPQHHERPPTKRRKVATDVIVEATKMLKAVADTCRKKSQTVREDRYSTLATHIAAELREMENVGGKAFATDTMQELIRCLMDRWDLLHATVPQPQPSTSGHFQATAQKAGTQEDDTL